VISALIISLQKVKNHLENSELVNPMEENVAGAIYSSSINNGNNGTM